MRGPERRQHLHCILLAKVGSGDDRDRRLICRRRMMESGFIRTKHNLGTDTAAVVRTQPRKMFQRTLVILLPHQQHGRLVIRLAIPGLDQQKLFVNAKSSGSRRLVAFRLLHIDPAQIQIRTCKLRIVQNGCRELLDGTIGMSLLNLDNA